MALGEPIGYSARITMNNSTLYEAQVNPFRRGVHIALLGDPTLRLDPVVPASNLSAIRKGGNVVLKWSPSPELVAGYYVYRAARPSGPFKRITPQLISGTKFSDVNQTLAATYMVRAVKLQITPSGSYWNPSQGIFAAVKRLGA